MTHLVGIDGGGTGCRAAVADAEGRVLGTGTSGPANIMTDLHQARESIVDAAHKACADASLDPGKLTAMSAVLGLAGAGAGERGRAIAAMLPFRRSIVETDVLIALHGALGDHDGAITIIGTGSVFAARTGGTVRRIGGWGFKIGDLGSGARIGRALLQEALLVHDGMRAPSALTDEVLARFGREPFALVEFAHTARPADFGAFAPVVFEHAEQGDPVALALVEGALRSVEEALAAVVPEDCERLCLLGGLGPRYAGRLGDRFRPMLRQPLGDALQGAVALARRRFGHENSAAAPARGAERRMESTAMRLEIGEIPQAVADLLKRGAPALERAGNRLRDRKPVVVATVARGSSDHAASYLNYAIGLRAGVPVASLAPSVASIFGARIRLDGAACLAISQSGRSPDIVHMARTAREGGALALALTNSPGSPLAQACDEVVDIMAGAEKSVAATKTFVNSVVAGLAILAHWTGDAALKQALEELPAQLEAAIGCHWGPLADELQSGSSLFILGRGPSLAIAQEAALKFKETCGIHAEAYSSAEFMHGPVSLIGRGFPALALIARDAAEPSSAEGADALVGKGAAAVFATSDKISAATPLPFVATGHPLTDPLVLIASFYSFIEAFARRRGLDPDRPMLLRKVTETR